MTKMVNEGNQLHNFISGFGAGTVINYGSGSDFLTSNGSGSTSQKVTVSTVPVPQHCIFPAFFIYLQNKYDAGTVLKNICSAGTRLPRILYCDFGR
jgi:hypothetical protein